MILRARGSASFPLIPNEPRAFLERQRGLPGYGIRESDFFRRKRSALARVDVECADDFLTNK
jgi:hypothetical protein